MSIYHSENLPETDDLVELTREELYWSTDLEDRQKVYLFKALDFTEKMGLRLFFCSNAPCLYVSDGEIFSEILGVEPPELCTLLFLLEFMLNRYGGGVTDEEAFNKIAQLEQRVSVLEKAMPVDGAVTESAPISDSRKQKLEELMTRAHAIGTRVSEHYKGGYWYTRPRFLIPGSRYKFYYYVGNAYNTKRRQQSARYVFGPDELDELERWVTHDEKIFAECNQQYCVPQG